MLQHVILEKLFAYQRGQLDATEKAKIQHHLAACTLCSQNAELVAQLYRPTEAKWTAVSAFSKSDNEKEMSCPPTEMVSKFLTGELPDVQRRELEEHLAVCGDCRAQLAEILRASFAPVSEEEKVLLASLPPLEVADCLRHILNLMPKPKPLPKPKSIGERIRQLVPIPVSPRLRPALAFAAILFVVAAGKWWLWPAYRYISFVQKSKALMVERFRIYYRHELRPAGNYLSSDTAQEMGGERETQPESIAVLLNTALAYHREGESAQRLLMQYYLLQGDDNRADSLLKILERSSPPNAAVLNDRGIWYCQQAQYDSAAIIFKRALALDPNLDEALYNLAITYTRLGNLAAAKETWQHYLTLNVPAEWRNAALTQLQELEEGLMR